MSRIARFIGRGNLMLGYAVAPLTLVITGLVLFEVLARALRSPTTWANEVNGYLQCALVMLAGGFTLRHYAHTRVDIVFSRFSEKGRAWVEVLTGLAVVVMAAPMFWFGLTLTLEGIATGETSASAAELPLWPSKATVPLGALFIGLQGIGNALDALQVIFPGRRPDQD